MFRSVVVGRRSARRFAEAPIPAAVVGELLAMTQRAPSSFNLQPWTCVVVQSRDQRHLLSRAMLSESNRRRVAEAPLTAVFAADLEPAALMPKWLEQERRRGASPERLDDLAAHAGYYASGGALLSMVKGAIARAASPLFPMPFPERAEAWATKPAMLAAQTFVLAATSHGLATAPMEGFDAQRAKIYLDVPDRYALPLLVAAGYPHPDDEKADDDESSMSPRFDPKDVFFDDSFGRPFHDGLVKFMDDAEDDAKDDADAEKKNHS